mmetsp:Transcript_77114/g.243644  ORF Transcript_77114/g.243644 Transcript_77114/m.243644 type:complete len:721 (+) Transcript_77114:250-2412(+)
MRACMGTPRYHLDFPASRLQTGDDFLLLEGDCHASLLQRRHGLRRQPHLLGHGLGLWAWVLAVVRHWRRLGPRVVAALVVRRRLGLWARVLAVVVGRGLGLGPWVMTVLRRRRPGLWARVLAVVVGRGLGLGPWVITVLWRRGLGLGPRELTPVVRRGLRLRLRVLAARIRRGIRRGLVLGLGPRAELRRHGLRLHLRLRLRAPLEPDHGALLGVGPCDGGLQEAGMELLEIRKAFAVGCLLAGAAALVHGANLDLAQLQAAHIRVPHERAVAFATPRLHRRRLGGQNRLHSGHTARVRVGARDVGLEVAYLVLCQVGEALAAAGPPAGCAAVLGRDGLRLVELVAGDVPVRLELSEALASGQVAGRHVPHLRGDASLRKGSGHVCLEVAHACVGDIGKALTATGRRTGKAARLLRLAVHGREQGARQVRALLWRAEGPTSARIRCRPVAQAHGALHRRGGGDASCPGPDLAPSRAEFDALAGCSQLFTARLALVERTRAPFEREVLALLASLAGHPAWRDRTAGAVHAPVHRLEDSFAGNRHCPSAVAQARETCSFCGGPYASGPDPHFAMSRLEFNAIAARCGCAVALASRKRDRLRENDVVDAFDAPVVRVRPAAHPIGASIRRREGWTLSDEAEARVAPDACRGRDASGPPPHLTAARAVLDAFATAGVQAARLAGIEGHGAGEDRVLTACTAPVGGVNTTACSVGATIYRIPDWS